MSRAERVVERLNNALSSMLGRHPDAYVLGEDLADPYGGAFGVTKNLSTRYPERVLSTPVSENGIIGVAGGLALCGNRVVVEVMFGDFVALGFDQILNFVTKSVTMYGQRRPMRLVVRCPVGGHRGYGPTHSQSPQKHFIGIPNLALYELSAFHDPEKLLGRAFDSGVPAMLFEPKALYAQRSYQDGYVNETQRYDFLDDAGDWVHVSSTRADLDGRPELVVITPGGTAEAELAAARVMAEDDRVQVHVLIPARLHPIDLEPATGLLSGADGICIAEESTAGGDLGI